MGLGIVSVLLALAAFLGAIAGFLLTPVPYLGAIMSLAAPLLALAAVVTGAVGMQRAKRLGDRSTASLVGLVAGVLVFCPSSLVAMTCGVCNAFFSSQGELYRTDGGLRFHVQESWSSGLDAGQADVPDAGRVADPIVTTPPPPPPGSWADVPDAAAPKPPTAPAEQGDSPSP